MRHAVALLVLAATLALALAALDRLAARGAGAGQVWVVSRGAPGPAMAGILRATRGSVLASWGDARVLVLHVDSLADARAPATGAWLFLRLPASLAVLPACA